MEINKTAFAIVIALCVGAGASGVYLTNRSTSADQPETASVVSLDPSLQPVEQSEALVTGDADLFAGVNPPSPRGPSAEASYKPSNPRTGADVAPSHQRVARQPSPSNEAPRSDHPVPPVESAPRLPAPPAIEPATPVQPVAPTAAAVEPVEPKFVDLVVPVDAVLGLNVETSHTSERARVEDEVVASVTRDVRVGDRIAIPAGSKAYGEVTLVERGGRMRNRARLGIRFTSVVLADGTRVPITTEAFYRESDAPGGESAAKIGGGAIGGAIIGGILGGAKGAVIGGSVGAGAGTAAVLAGGRNAATLAAGTPVTVRLVEPATVTVER